jgi:thiamine-monophosphate kinase
MNTLRELGEFGLIRRIHQSHPASSRSVLLGIGDDAAMIRADRRRAIVVTTDLLVEGLDFDLGYFTYRQIGHKALAANLSDIAAMGAVPRWYLVGLALPQDTPSRAADELYRGMDRLRKANRLELIGGDLSASPKAVHVGITLIGQVEPALAVRRSGARPGDLLMVTGPLGDAAAGLEILKNRGPRPKNSHERSLIRKQVTPSPRLREGRLLAARRLASSMIDLSDGLASDLRRLCEASGVGARLFGPLIPTSNALNRYAAARGRDPVSYALTGGEDFELLFTVSPARLNRLDAIARRTGLLAYPIGEILPKRHRLTLIGPDDRSRPLTERGYDHFLAP